MGIDRRELEYYESMGIDTKAKSFSLYHQAGWLEKVDESFLEEVGRYWEKHYHSKIDPLLHIAYLNYTGLKEPRLIPQKISWNQVIPFFNDQEMNETFKDKNLYDKLIPSDRAVETVLKRAHGLYFDQQNNYLDKTEALNEILTFKKDFIVKPSNTNNGQGIRKIYYKEGFLYLKDEKLTLEALENIYGANFAVQKAVQQHPIMSDPHPDSVNTLRMVTLRWKGEIKYLLTFARFGANNNVLDNTSHGGVSIGVKESGEFMDKALDRNFEIHHIHPTTGFPFKDMKPVPNFDKFKQYVIDLHKHILHHDFVSWGIVVGNDGLPVFLEANFRGGTWFYQLLSEKPLFGDLTEEILEYMHKERKDENSPRHKNYSKLQPTPKKQSKQIKKLKDEKQKLKNERDQFEKKYNNVMRSTSWKITRPVRKISGLLKKR